MKRLFTISVLCVLFAAYSYPQTYTASIGTAKAATGEEKLIPVNVTGFNNIGAITFYISYDHNVLTYQSIQNIHTELAGMIYNDDGTFLKISWDDASMAGKNFGNSKLFDIKFKLKTGNTTICFDTANSMAADISTMDYVAVTWICGEVIENTGVNQLTMDNGQLKIFPNPADDMTNIKYQISNKSQITIKVFDLTGREIAEVINQTETKGEHSLNFNTEKLSDGIYFLKLQCEGQVGVRKIVVKH